VGRGAGSGKGKTCGRGHKGQKSRSGGSIPPWFEGGQMPIIRRVPKRGFHNRFRREYGVVNLKDLSRFPADTVITPQLLHDEGLVKGHFVGVKILSDGELTAPIHVKAHKFSARAKEKIEAAGGTAEVLEG
jgi:large subunit ribosomal protein L15